MFQKTPIAQELGLQQEVSAGERMVRWVGGETRALENLSDRMQVEEAAFRRGFYLPNQSLPDLLGPPTSQSAALRFGCLSVRRFYWQVHDLFRAVHGGEPPASESLTSQLIWREYFYTMSLNNQYYGEMARNKICLDIPWREKDIQTDLDLWKQGKTGYPFIDAAMRQLLAEGWLHHVGRNAVATFLTRGDLWISWEEGLKHFLYYLLDADWSVCAGNWMWVSSSAFERLLDCSHCVCPVSYGRRLDPDGEYVRRYIPELRNFPIEYLYEPWKAPLEIQKKSGCIIGQSYPERIVDHSKASHKNRQVAKGNQMRWLFQYMEALRASMVSSQPPHCCPSNDTETRQFMWLPPEGGLLRLGFEMIQGSLVSGERAASASACGGKPSLLSQDGPISPFADFADADIASN
nr:unnamed protein product [Timema poppensis]